MQKRLSDLAKSEDGAIVLNTFLGVLRDHPVPKRWWNESAVKWFEAMLQSRLLKARNNRKEAKGAPEDESSDDPDIGLTPAWAVLERARQTGDPGPMKQAFRILDRTTFPWPECSTLASKIDRLTRHGLPWAALWAKERFNPVHAAYYLYCIFYDEEALLDLFYHAPLFFRVTVFEDVQRVRPDLINEGYVRTWTSRDVAYAVECCRIPDVVLDNTKHTGVVSETFLTMLESRYDADREKAYSLILANPKRVRFLSRDLLSFLAPSMWDKKLGNIGLTIQRIEKGIELGIIPIADGAATIEQGLLTESATVIQAAAAALRKLRRKDATLLLKNPKRVRELIQRDPAKLEKTLAPLLA